MVLSSFFFIGLGNVHLFDWDEINFAESAREMIESGDYLRVQINYLPFWEKPPFFFCYFWLPVFMDLLYDWKVSLQCAIWNPVGAFVFRVIIATPVL